jgi:hypothetical protein
MKYLKFLLVGIFFGIVLVKSEAVSWFRIFEMFQFQSFHMYGIIGSAVVTGIILLFFAKKLNIFTINGEAIKVPKKDKTVTRYLIGGSIFGLGWALVGACPGPLFVLFGAGFYTIGIVILAAIFGTLVYGILREKLPH